MTITTIDQIRFADPPNKKHVLRATLKLNTATFPDKRQIFVKNPLWENSNEANAGNLTSGTNPKYFVTQVETVARMGAGWDLVEVIAYIPQAGNQSTQLYEVVYDDVAGPVYMARPPLYDRDLLTRLTTSSNLIFKVKLKDVADPVEVPITVGGFSKLHRRGKVMITAKNFATVPNNGGELQWWWTIEAGSPQARLTLNWHNGNAVPTGDVVFAYAQLEDRGGNLKWAYELLDPAGDFINRYLIKNYPVRIPGTVGVNTDPEVGPTGTIMPVEVPYEFHILPMRMERSWRLVVFKGENPPDVNDHTWGISNSWGSGGYFPDDVAIHLDNIGNLRVVSDYITDISALVTVNSTQYIGQHSNANFPVSFAWPARDVKYGGRTGGVGTVHFEGCRWAASGRIEGRYLHMIDMLRMRSRHQSCIYSDSEPIIPDDFTSPAGTATWKMTDKKFEDDGGTIRDLPFGFDTFQSRGTPFDNYGTSTPSLGFTSEANYAPQEFDPIDDQHGIRQIRSSMALVWLDNDPLAKQYITSDAAIARMSDWEATSTYAGGMRKQSDMISGEVLALGRENAHNAITIAFAYAINDDEWRANYATWLEEFSLAAIQSQANQTGGSFGGKERGKVVMEPAFDSQMAATGTFVPPPDFWVQQAVEEAHLARVMWMIGQVIGGSRLDDNAAAVRTYAIGLWERCWKSGTEGPYQKSPVGSYGGASPTQVPLAVYANRAAFPAGLLDAMAYLPPDSYQIAASLGIAYKAAAYLGAGTAEIELALAAFANQAEDLNEAWNNINSWGISTSGASNSPCENYIASKAAIFDLI